MRILYFHQHFSTPAGSSGIRSYEMAKRLISRGHSVTMVCGSYKGGITGLTIPFSRGVRRGSIDNINIIEFELEYSNAQSFTQRTKAFLLFALKSIKLVFTEKYDLLFATTTPLTASLPGITTRWLRRKPFIFEVRDLWPELPKAMGVIKNPVILAVMKFLEWLSYKSAHALIALSPGIKQGILRSGIPENRVIMIPNGCDLDIFHGDKVSGQCTGWQPDGVHDTDLMAVYTGTHGIANGLDIVIETAYELKQKHRHDIKIVLVGQGLLKQQLMDRAKKLQLTNVIFHQPVNKKRLAQLMKRADLGLQILANIPAFYYGTSPNKFFDYLAAGLPILNNYPGWITDLIEQTNCGKAIPPENKIAFAETLIYFADNRNLLPEMGNAAKALAERQFDRKLLSSEFADWLEKWNSKIA